MRKAGRANGSNSMRNKWPMLLVGAVLFCCLVSSVAAHRSAHLATVAPAPKRLKIALSCLFAAQFMRQYNFTPLGFKEGDWIWVRYHVGTIPGIEATPRAYNIVIYSRDDKSGFVLDAEPNSLDGFTATRNDYSLRKKRKLWYVIEGEGGFRDYEAVERLVNRLSSQPRYRVQLLPGGKECDSD